MKKIIALLVCFSAPLSFGVLSCSDKSINVADTLKSTYTKPLTPHDPAPYILTKHVDSRMNRLEDTLSRRIRESELSVFIKINDLLEKIDELIDTINANSVATQQNPNPTTGGTLVDCVRALAASQALDLASPQPRPNLAFFGGKQTSTTAPLFDFVLAPQQQPGITLFDEARTSTAPQATSFVLPSQQQSGSTLLGETRMSAGTQTTDTLQTWKKMLHRIRRDDELFLMK
jgi:hypothetical protein